MIASEWTLVSSHDQDKSQMMNRAGNMLFLAETIGQLVSNGITGAMQWDLPKGWSQNSGSCYELLKVSE